MRVIGYILLGLLILIIGGLGYFYIEYKHLNIPFKTEVPLGEEASAFTLPPGFTMSVFARNVEDARVIAIDPSGTLLVSEPQNGKIVALPDKDGNGADEQIVVAQNLNRPHGMEFKCAEGGVCTLYVAETSQLVSFEYDSTTHTAPNKKKLLDLPQNSTTAHYTRTLLFMPSPNENTLLIAVGSSCNVCNEEDQQRAKILAYDIKTGKTEEFARGLRNSVFMAIHPVTGAIWATEMGRDGLGDDIPPDEINILEKGKNYGWPICYGQNIHDTAFDHNTYIRNPCMTPFETASYIDLQAHSAPLGISFIPEEGWSEDYWYNALVAFHGSWNRSVPTGYTVERIKLDAKGKYLGMEHFITGWLLPNGKTIGRPADVKVLPGGVIYISDDQANLVYKVTTAR